MKLQLKLDDHIFSLKGG